MHNVMIDLETMGTRPDSAIVAIGAVEFDVEYEFHNEVSPKMGREFYAVVDLQSSIDAGLKITGNTVYWWLQQSEAARNALCTERRKSLFAALGDFTDFWNGCNADYIWARGIDFDVSILKTAYAQSCLSHPFRYNACRDSRTYFHARGFTKAQETMVPVRGIAHNALDDAKWEARAVLAAMTGTFI